MNQEILPDPGRSWPARSGSPAVRTALAALAASLAITACGSTVPARSASSFGPAGPSESALGQDGLGQDGLAADSGLPAGPDGTTAGSARAGSGAGESVGSAAGGGGSAVAGGAGGSSGASGGGGAQAPVASKTVPIKIGVITQSQLEGAAKAIGLDGVSTGDTRKQVDAVVAWIRANGGLGGRPIQVYEHAVDLSDGSSDAIQNKACVALSQDLKVDFAVTVIGGLRTLTTCLAKSGIGLLADNAGIEDKFRAQYAGTLASPSEAAPGRLMTLLVDHLVKRDWLTSTSKIGLMARDNPDGRAIVEQYLKPALRRAGLKEVITEYVDDTKGDGGSNQSNSAVLRFRSAGVDRFIPAFYSPLYFMLAAERQGYYPAYTISSPDAPGALLESLAPANQLENSVGMGWQPYLDIGKGTKPGPVSPRETLCFELMAKAGQQASSTLVKGFQVQVCDLLMYLKDLSDRRPAMPADLLTSGRTALGGKYVSPATYRVDVTKRTDGMAGFRPLSNLENCECFQYVGPVTATP